MKNHYFAHVFLFSKLGRFNDPIKVHRFVPLLLPAMLFIFAAWMGFLLRSDGGKYYAIAPLGLAASSIVGITAYILSKLASLHQDDVNFSTRSIFSVCPIPMALINNNDISILNEEFIKVFGYTQEDIPTIDDWWSKAYPEIDYRKSVVEAWRSRLKSIKSDGTGFEPLEVRVRCKCGETKFALATATPLDLVTNRSYLVTLYDISEQVNTRNALIEACSVLQCIIETIPMRVFWKDRNSRYLGCNTAFARDCGEVSPREVIGKIDSQMFWKDEADLYRADDQLVIQTNLPRLAYEEPQTTPEGRKIWLRTSKVPLRSMTGETIGVLGVYEDYTERKETENELWLAKTIIDKSETACFRLSPTGMIQYVNDHACQFLGYSRDELIGMYLWDFDPDYPADAWPATWEVLKKNGTINIETRHRRKGGAVHNVNVTGHYISINGEEFNFAYVQDVTERKQAEIALRMKESYQRALIDNFPFLVWLKDTHSRFLAVNQVFAKSFGFKNADELVGKSDFEITSPDLAKAYQADDLEVMASRQKKTIEEEIENLNGRRWIETFKAPVVDEGGELLGTVGFARDITERKLVEADLRISAAIFESQEGMIITDSNTVILKINQAFTRITGYTAEDALGREMKLLRSGLHDKAFYTEMWNSINCNGSWQGEIWNKRKSGEIYPEWLTITAIKSDNGTVTNYVGTMIDITIRKATEEKVHHLAHHDVLTDLPNRALLSDRLRQSIAQARREKGMMALLYLDLDKFKPVNDTLGHQVGDQLLKEVALRLLACVKRESDTVSRLGGDEFVVLLAKIANESDAAIIAEKILYTLNQPFLIHSHTINISSSIGVATYPTHATDDLDLMKKADNAMYEAKRAGRSCFRLYTPDIQ